jgi:hypothetical protein
MTSLTETPASLPGSVGHEDGECGEILAVFEVPDPFLYQDMRWCEHCAGPQLFFPVDRLPFGWRGYCMGCGETKYAMDTRMCSGVAA